jgi:hypothetical protein
MLLAGEIRITRSKSGKSYLPEIFFPAVTASMTSSTLSTTAAGLEVDFVASASHNRLPGIGGEPCDGCLGRF